MYQQRLKKWIVCVVIALLVLFTVSLFVAMMSTNTAVAFAKDYELKSSERYGEETSLQEADSFALETKSDKENKGEYKNLGKLRLSEGDQGLTQLHYIENANYFLANPLHHDNDGSDNVGGTCTSVALQMLVGYHNYYSDRRLLPKVNNNGKKLLEDDYGSLNEHPTILSSTSSANGGLGRSSIGTANGVYERIYEETFWASFPGLGQALGSVTGATRTFLEKDSNLNNWSLEKNSYQKSYVLSELDAGRPVVIAFDFFEGNSAHVIVAYGYATYEGELCFITHYGWGSGYVQMLVPESWLGYQVTMNVNHAHIFQDTGETYNGTYRALKCKSCGYTTLDDKYIISLFAGGTGAIYDPFLISNETQFRNMVHAYRSVYITYQGYENQINYAFKLTNNISISGDWSPFPYKFSGDFDGGGHYISYKMHLTQEDIDTSIYQGLFGFVVNGGKIHDLELMNCTITSDTGTTLSNSNRIIDIGIVAATFYEAVGLVNVTVTNPKIECKISNASIGALLGSCNSGYAENCVVRQLNGTSSITNNTHGYLGGLAGLGDIYRFGGCSVTISLTNTSFNSDNDMMGEVVGNSSNSPSDYNIKANVTMDKGSCLTPGTLITLADGRQVPVETLTGNESLLVWNLHTGQFDTAPILFIDREPLARNRVINLAFSDGTMVKVISEHGFWDCDLNKYVYLDKNASKYIGHWFLQSSEGSTQRVQLSDVEITYETTTAYSPVTANHLCYFVNGMLSMPGGIDGLFNIFEVDSDTMHYNQEAFDADIAKYGLFTYEEFYELLSVSQEVFDAFNAQYFKVAIGKDLITVERLVELFERYGDFLEEIG